MLSWTNTREPAQQTCPWLKRIPRLQTVHRHIPLAVFKIDIRALSSQFQRCRNQFLCGGLSYADAYLAGAGKGQLTDIRVVQDWPDLLPAPVTILTTPGGRRSSISPIKHSYSEK